MKLESKRSQTYCIGFMQQLFSFFIGFLINYQQMCLPLHIFSNPNEFDPIADSESSVYIHRKRCSLTQVFIYDTCVLPPSLTSSFHRMLCLRHSPHCTEHVRKGFLNPIEKIV